MFTCNGLGCGFVTDVQDRADAHVLSDACSSFGYTIHKKTPKFEATK